MFTVSKRPTINEIQTLYKIQKATPSQVVNFFLNRIKSLDLKLNAFYEITSDLAIKTALIQDKLLEENKDFNTLIEKYPLFGIPYSLKTIILAEDFEFNASSKILKNYIAPYSSTVFTKIKNAGGILIGTVNMDEFAMGASGESGAYGVVRNPFDTDRVPGGSSAGSACSVGSGEVVFSLGTDTGGSIRQPSAFCDTVGLKPTYGLVSRFGVIPMASSLDQVGPITNSVTDNLLIISLLAGQDTNDQTSINSTSLIKKLKDLHKKQTISSRKVSKILKTSNPIKIGIPKEFFIEGIDPSIQNAIQDLVLKLKKIGHETIEISLPMNHYAIAVYYLMMSVEVAANLERVDGVRYAMQENKHNELFFEHRDKYFGEEAKRRIMLGTYASSAGYLDAYYKKALAVRELAKQDYEKAFQKCDLILAPTTPEFPFKIGDKTSDPLKMYLSDVFTCGINPVQIPGLNVPLGLLENDESQSKLPSGCQILGPELSEDRIYTLAIEVENLIQSNNK